MPERPSPPLLDRWFVAYTRRAAAAPWRVLALAALCFLGSILLASRLEIRGSFVHLLPTWDPTAQRYNGALARKGGSGSSLDVVIESPDAAQNRRFVEALEARVRTLPPGQVTRIDHGPEQLRAYYDRWRWLFASERDLALVECELGKARASAAPGWVDVDDPCSVQVDEDYGPAPEAQKPTGAAPAKPAVARVAAIDRFPTGYYQNREGTRFLLKVFVPGAGFGEFSSDALVRRVESFVADLEPTTFHPSMQVGFAGDIPNAIAEREALIDDIWTVGGLGVGLILASIVLYFRSGFALLHIGLSMGTGAALAFAVASVAYGHLNAATSFLVSIIAGNGINHSIMYLARYRERRAQGDTLDEALEDATLTVRNGTWLAALAAGGAYACLLTTSFRGFSEFGLIGGAGMIACWCATFLVMPASIAALERVRVGRARSGAAAATSRFFATGWIARAAARAPMTILAIAAAIAVAAALPLPRYLADPWEYNFSRLTSRSSKISGAGKWSDKSNEVSGVRGAPVLLLSETMTQAPQLAAAIHAADKQHGGDRFFERVETIYDYLGGPPDVVKRKLDLLGEIRKHIDAIRPRLKGEDARIANEWRPPDRLRPPATGDLPPLLLEVFTERDGRVGTPVYAYLARGISQSNGANILAITSILEAVRLPDGTIAPNASRATVFAAVIRSMARDAPRATFAALLLVVLVTVLVTRRWVASAAVLGSVAVAVLLTVGGAAWLGVRLNFLNFIAIPLTFGIGVEYAINLFDRIRFQGGDVVAAITSAGGAVFLCSLTTIIGYGSLLIADSPALQSFGKYAIAGEFACILTALLVMPASLHAAARRRRARPETRPS
jgi:predicted exporter